MKVSKIAVARLYNLGSYEHVRYELSVEVPADESAGVALIGLERILEGLRPNKMIKDQADFSREFERIKKMRMMSDEEFSKEHRGYQGTRAEIIARYQKSLDEDIEKTRKALELQRKARTLLDDVGAAVEFKDAKLSWDNDDDGVIF